MGGQPNARPLYPEKDPDPLYGRLGGPQDRSGKVRKISTPQGFDPRTVSLSDSLRKKIERSVNKGSLTIVKNVTL